MEERAWPEQARGQVAMLSDGRQPSKQRNLPLPKTATLTPVERPGFFYVR